MTHAASKSSPVSAALRRDLSLVLPEFPQPPVALKAHDLDEQARHIAERFNASVAPAIVGLGKLSIEAARWAVALAERVRGKLLPWPLPPELSPVGASVVQTATLGHLFASDLIIWVGCTGTDSPITEAIAARQLRASFVEPTLDVVMQLRAQASAGGALHADAKRIGVVLSPTCDARVANQWHKLAAQVQQQTRVAVVRLPDLAQYQNMRGVLEVITWQTGLSCASGGVDFADGAPRPCADYGTLRANRGIDYALEPAGILAPCAARVMRFDGVVLWLCDDPRETPPDPTAALLEAVFHHVRRPS